MLFILLNRIVFAVLLVIGPPNPAIHGIRVASAIAFSVCLFSVLCVYVCYIFLMLLQYNIRPLDPNCDVCDPEFAAGLNLRRRDTLT